MVCMGKSEEIVEKQSLREKDLKLIILFYRNIKLNLSKISIMMMIMMIDKYNRVQILLLL